MTSRSFEWLMSRKGFEMKINVNMNEYYADIEAMTVRTYHIEYTERVLVYSTKGWTYRDWIDYDPYSYISMEADIEGDPDELADFIAGIYPGAVEIFVNGQIYC